MLTVKWGQTKSMRLGLSTSVTAVVHKNNFLDQLCGWTVQNTMHASYESAPCLIGEHNDDTCRGKVQVIRQFLTPAHIHTHKDPLIQTRMSPSISTTASSTQNSLLFQSVSGRTNMGNDQPRPTLCFGMSQMFEGLDSKSLHVNSTSAIIRWLCT